MSTEERLREALTEWQGIATDMSDALLRLGDHPEGQHQAPSQYDSMSVLACTLPRCLAELASPHVEELRAALKAIAYSDETDLSAYAEFVLRTACAALVDEGRG